MTVVVEPGDAPLRPWQVDLADFPVCASTAELLRFTVGYAVLAPSSHNTQPWQFGIGDDHLDLYADQTRSLPVSDPDDRELSISCGAALFNLRLAVSRLGYRPCIYLLPDPKDPALLARVRLDGDHEPTDRDLWLFDQIVRRRTSRAAFRPDPLPAFVLDELPASAAAEDAWLYLTTDPAAKARLAELVADGDRRQMADRRFRRELARWIRSNRGRQRDGIRGYGLGMTDVMSRAAPLVVRTFDQGRGRAAGDQAIAQGSPALAVVGTERDEPVDWLRAGQALQRLLLTCVGHGISVGFLNQPIEVDAVRAELAHAVGRIGYPQLLLRLGYGPEQPAEPRRMVRDVMVEDPTSSTRVNLVNPRSP